MIILDTNVLSALMQRDPPERVVVWLDRQPRASVYTSAVTLFEIEHGLRRLPDGSKRRRLQSACEKVITDCLAGRVLSFDAAAAREAGTLAAASERQGLSIGMRDLQIAGITRANNATIATRNTKDFTPTCPLVVNPWDEG